MGTRSTKLVAAGFTIRTASRVSGLSVHMLNYMCRNEIVMPSENSRRGRGVVRRYSFEDILLLKVIKKLLDQGVSTLRLKDAFNGIRSRGGSGRELLSKRFVVTNGQDVFFQDGGIVELLSSGQFAFAFVLELESLRKDVSLQLKSPDVAAA